MAEVDDDPQRKINKGLKNIDKQLNQFFADQFAAFDGGYLVSQATNMREVMEAIKSQFFDFEKNLKKWLRVKMKSGKHYAPGGKAARETVPGKYAFVNWGKDFGIAWDLADVMRIEGILIGTDKIGHFFSDGFSYWKEYIRTGSEQKAKEWGDITERGIWGLMSSGVYSKADLEANLQGFTFYKKLAKQLAPLVKDQNNVTKEERKKIVATLRKLKFDITEYTNKNWNEFENLGYVDKTTRAALDKSGEKFHKDKNYFKEPLWPGK